MPYEIVWEEKGIYVRNFGTLSEQELYDQLDESNSDTRMEKIDYMVWDALEVDHFIAHGSSTLLLAIADARLSEKTGPVKNALVAKDPHIIEMCRHYMEHMDRLGSTWGVKQFGDLASAREWVLSE